MNLFDRAVLAINPERAEARVRARISAQAMEQLGGSALVQLQASNDGPVNPEGSARGGSRWWNPRPRDARSDTLSKLPLQRGQSRELARTNPIAAGAINTNVDRIVGTGLALSSNPNRFILGWSAEQAAEWKSRYQAEFSMWADSTMCDWAQTQTFYEMQATALRGVKESGDVFTMLPNGERSRMAPYALRLQLLEADRVGNPGGAMDTADVAGGIRIGANGAPTACHVYRRHPGAGYMAGGKLYEGDWVDYVGRSGRRRILHHFRKLRPEQPRGVPYLAPIVELIKQIGRYTDAEISAAVVSAFFTVFIEGTANGNPAPVFAGQPGADAAGSAKGDDIGLGMGAVVGLAPGEKASFANPSRPNPNFDGFIVAMLRQVGMALGLPVELLIKQFNSSYSASKAAILDAWIYIRSERVWLANSFCQPIHETLMAEMVALGRISAPGFFTDPLLRWAYTRASWHGDSMGSINPKDEVAAYSAAVEARLMTRERAEWELFGSDFNDTTPHKAAEEELLRSLNIAPVPKAGAAAPADDRSSAPSPTR
jgi:lambda family phage portal protein